MANNIASMFSLDGKVALVTGASRGIGEEIARVYALAGARLAICSRKKENIEEAAEKIRGMGSDVLPIIANVSVAEDRKRAIDEAMNWAGRIDILVNNAGTNPAYGPLEDITQSAWDKTFDTNLNAILYLSQLVFHAWMKDHGGCIVNTASMAAFCTMPLLNTYHVTKASVVHLTKCLACEWGPYNIRVNALAPGVLKTKLSQALWDGPQGEEAAKSLPLKRLGESEDVGGAALLLASDAGSYITGHTLVIDGGSLVRSLG